MSELPRPPGRSRNIPFVCPPPRLPSSTPRQRLADRLQPTGANQWIFFAAVAAGISVAPVLPTRPGLALGAVVTFAGSAWCLINFRRCREAHCVVSGYGWAALALLETVELALGRSFIMGAEGLAFVAVLVVALVFECGWRARTGTNALIRIAPPDAK